MRERHGRVLLPRHDGRLAHVQHLHGARFVLLSPVGAPALALSRGVRGGARSWRGGRRLGRRRVLGGGPGVLRLGAVLGGVGIRLRLDGLAGSGIGRLEAKAGGADRSGEAEESAGRHLSLGCALPPSPSHVW